jgi:AbrB family looped-hinge helix DNA binding protein
MSIVKVDRRGRITLPKKLRKTLGIGEKVLIVNMGGHLQIIPLPSDPFEALEGTLSINKSFKELRKQAELVAEEGATVELG